MFLKETSLIAPENMSNQGVVAVFSCQDLNLFVFAAGEEAVPMKKTKTIVSTSQMASSQTRVQRVRHTENKLGLSKRQFYRVIWLTLS